MIFRLRIKLGNFFMVLALLILPNCTYRSLLVGLFYKASGQIRLRREVEE